MDSFKLELAPNKSFAMIFSKYSKKSFISQKNLKFVLNGVEIEIFYSIKCLGVIIDHKLSWSAHIKALARKATMGAFFMQAR